MTSRWDAAPAPTAAQAATAQAARRRRASRPKVALMSASTAAALLALAACGGGGQPSAPDAGTVVTLVTHDSFAVDPAVLQRFEQESGLTIKQVAPGDAGALVNQLILTKDNPLGDVVYGIDNAFASRAVQAGILQPYTSPAAGSEQQMYEVGDGGQLTAIDYSDVCVNVDHTWFADKGLAEPATLQDLTKPQYKDLLTVENPATSSPGLAFLLATVGAFGQDGWQEYWAQLKDNGVQVASGWTEAYYTDFSGADGKGPRPLVVSYASSPPVTVPEGAGESPTGALLGTCFRQVEYAGVLAGAKNPQAAQEVVDFLLSADFQQGLPEQMYVYPIVQGTPLPDSWVKYAPLAVDPFTVAPQDISEHRDEWIQQWTDVVVG